VNSIERSITYHLRRRPSIWCGKTPGLIVGLTLKFSVSGLQCIVIQDPRLVVRQILFSWRLPCGERQDKIPFDSDFIDVNLCTVPEYSFACVAQHC
jgi:hypothetical protein